MRREREEGTGAAKQRVLLGSFLWVPVSQRLDGTQAYKPHWVHITLDIEPEDELSHEATPVQKVGEGHGGRSNSRQTELWGGTPCQKPSPQTSSPEAPPEAEGSNEERRMTWLFGESADQASHGSPSTSKSRRKRSASSPEATTSQQHPTPSTQSSTPSRLTTQQKQSAQQLQRSYKRWRTSKSPAIDSVESSENASSESSKSPTKPPLNPPSAVSSGRVSWSSK